MKKKVLFAAVALVALAGCTNDDFVGENSNTPIDPPTTGEIAFGLGISGSTRADVYGNEAAALLGNNFYVTGTKGTEAETSPTPNLVFDNYLVHYGINTAGTTTSNTANWEYVGVTPGSGDYANYVKLATTAQVQSIKYWDYSVDQYDFLAFSTGTKKAVNSTSPAGDEIGVTAMKYGTALASSGVAYTFHIPSADAIKNVYISDITEVKKTNYGKEVQLRFKNLGSKVRIALYETVPGYSVKDVAFYAVDGTNTDLGTATKTATATLISADANGIPTKGKIEVYFPNVGNDNQSKTDYDKAAANVTVATGTGSAVKAPTFGTLDKYAGKELHEEDATQYLGRTLPTATFAGSADAGYYQTVFPVSSSSALTLRVDYTLVSTDGSGEEIKVYGAKAVVPATYTKWLPNYAYTYIFKISDNSNGWTSTAADRAGLFPITFDAVVAEATEATGEQKTVTTVATPSITTYQQNHNITKNEYSIATGKDIYVQVMDNSTATSSLVTTLSSANALLYAVSDADATEAKVMDALEKRTTDIGANDVTGRNSITLTKNANIDAAVTTIVNGADDQPITVTAGQAAKITISSLTAGTYAFVYDYTSDTKTTVMEYQPIDVSSGTVGVSGKTYYSITTTALDAITVTAAAETVDNNYIYFSKITNGGSTTTYSYISIAGKAGMTLPAGVVKVAKSEITTTATGGSSATSGTFYFDKYITNDGKYAVKVIKIVA